MLTVCDGCGAWLDDVPVVDGAVVCAHCGYRRPFLQLPLFQVTGASGAGKTAVARELPTLLHECVVLDQDVLLSDLPWEQQRRNWLRLAMNIHQGGRSCVLIGTQLPEHYASLAEHRWFTEIHYVALTCDEFELAHRLRERPAWRRVTEATIVEMQRFNAWLRANASSTSPPMTVLETTDAEPAATAAVVAAWVRERLARAGRR